MVTLLLIASLTYIVPDGWVARQPSSSMRVAEFMLPRASGDAEDGDLVLYFFGGTGGSVSANLDRWIGQMTQPDGRPSRESATTSTLTTNGLKITRVDVAGTYVAEVRPGSAERHHKPGFRLHAAVIETPEGPYFVKLVGPARTVARWESSVDAFLKSVRHSKPGALALPGLPLHSSIGTPDGFRPILVRNTPPRMAAAPAIFVAVTGFRNHRAATPSAAIGTTLE